MGRGMKILRDGVLLTAVVKNTGVMCNIEEHSWSECKDSKSHRGLETLSTNPF